MVYCQGGIKERHSTELFYIDADESDPPQVGDGVNDWAALAGASVGVAVAKSAADVPHMKGGVLLLRDNGVEAIPLLLKVASQTHTIIKQVRP